MLIHLMYVLINGHIETVKLLINNDADINWHDNTPLLYVAERIREIKDKEIRDEYIDIAYILIKAMINYYSSLKDSTSNKLDLLFIQSYFKLLQRTISLPRVLFIEILSHL